MSLSHDVVKASVEQFFDTQNIFCPGCGHVLESSDITVQSDGKICCNECGAFIGFSICQNCGQIERTKYMASLDGDMYCWDCAHDMGYEVCEECGQAFCLDNEGAYIEGKDICVCDDCLNRFYWRCSECGAYVHMNEAVHLGREHFCPECATEYAECTECGECVSADEAYYDDNGNAYCAACYENRQEHYHILPYHAGHPSGLNFYGEGTRYFGVELETENMNNSEIEHHEIAGQVLELAEQYLHMEFDGSVSDGFEVITQPMTLDYWKKEFFPLWKRVLNGLNNEGYQSHNTTTCGLHIHVSRAGMSVKAARVLNALLWKNKTEFEVFARRKENGYCRYPETPDWKDRKSTRYLALNSQNYETWEFRLFKGSLKPETVLASLEFVDGLVTWAETCESEQDALSVTWDEIMSHVIKGTTYLRDYLVGRALYWPEVHETLNVTIGDILKEKKAA